MNVTTKLKFDNEQLVVNVQMPITHLFGILALIGPTSVADREKMLLDVGAQNEAEITQALHLGWSLDFYQAGMSVLTCLGVELNKRGLYEIRGYDED